MLILQLNLTSAPQVQCIGHALFVFILFDLSFLPPFSPRLVTKCELALILAKLLA